MTFEPANAMTTTRHPQASHAEPAGAREKQVPAPRAPRPTDAHEPDALLAGVRSAIGAGDLGRARRDLAMLVDRTDGYRHWLTGAQLAAQVAGHGGAVRSAKVAVLGSYTISPQPQFLQLAGLRFGLDLDVYEAPYGQYRQEILDAGSPLHRFAPDIVIIAVHAGDLSLPWHTGDPSGAVEAELARWTGLWRRLRERGRALIVQHNFVTPAARPLGHLGARLPGARPRLIQALDERLADAAGPGVVVLDCEWLSGLVGKRVWCDDGHWHSAKHAVGPRAQATLARHTAAVLAAHLGLTRKCLVVDLDNTLWGGVIGEDGVAGIRLGGHDPVGEAFVALQDYLLELKDRGLVLAVASKNNEADAMEPFDRHPFTRLRRDDFATVVANWEPKTDNLRKIAQRLNIGTDALVFLDDNPVERELVRQQMPEVEVIELPPDPAGYRRAVADCLVIEPASFTREDGSKTEQYRARAEITRLEAEATSLEDFWRSLQMRAGVAPFDPLHLPRIAQLIGKTNQWNLTTRRRTLTELEALIEDPVTVHRYLTLRDRFTDHGLVSVLIARQDGPVLDIDTWLMSCRVIGRSVDAEMLMHLCDAARRRGCPVLRGTYIPSARNQLVERIYASHGFTLVAAQADGTTIWEYDLETNGPVSNEFCGTGGIGWISTSNSRRSSATSSDTTTASSTTN